MKISKQDIDTLIHDCRAPVRHIRQFASLAKEDAAQCDNESLNASLSTIIDRVHILEAMIDGLADISGIATAEVKNTRVDLQKLLESHTLSLGLKLEASDLPTVSFDANLLSITIREILKNAGNYAEDGNLQVVFDDRDEEHQKLTLSNQVAVAYEKYPGNLAMPFTKPDKRPTKESVGVGLSLAHTAMSRGGGELNAEYNSNRFVVTLSFRRST